MIFELPEPPSVNAMWRRVGAKTLLSKRGREFRRDVESLARRQMIRQGAATIRDREVEVDILWRRRVRRGDVDNICKGILDSLNGLAYADDRQVVALRVRRVDDKANPGATVTVRAA